MTAVHMPQNPDKTKQRGDNVVGGIGNNHTSTLVKCLLTKDQKREIRNVLARVF
jgi:hypothetical protein